MACDELREGERDAFTCPKCGGRVVLLYSMPTTITGLGSIDFRCLGCGDWIDVVVDKDHIYQPVSDFEAYATGTAIEYFEARASEMGDEGYHEL